MTDNCASASFRVLMVMICTHCTIGGAEKRYARVFKMLVNDPNIEQKLLISRAMFDLLKRSNILGDEDLPHLMLMDPPGRKTANVANWKPLRRLLSAVLGLFEVSWYTWHYWRTVQQYKPDIVHPLLTALYLSLPIMLLRSSQRYVTSEYSTLFRPREHAHNSFSVDVAVRLKELALKKSRLIDALKYSIRDNLIAVGIDEDQICVAPCSFTDVTLCAPADQREKWIVFLARLIDHKNPLLFVRAIPWILDAHPDAHFYILGRGPLEGDVVSLLQDLQVEDYVTTGFEAHPTRLLARSSVFVTLQAQDNYPSQSLLEAMACGNAIVATDVGETWRLVDEQNGTRVPAMPEAVAAAVNDLLARPDLVELGQNARQRVLTEYTAERFFAYITNVYARAMRD